MERDSPDRFRATYVQECTILAASGPLEALACNVSVGGLFVLVDAPLEAGQTVRVSFAAPGTISPLEAEAEVVRSSEEPPGYGLRFTRLSPEAQGRLEDLVQNHRRVERRQPPFRSPYSGVIRVPYLRRCHVARSSGRVSAVVCNLSTLGAYIATHAGLGVGEAVRLELPLPGGPPGLDTRATVAWTNAGRTRRLEVLPAGCGLRFDALTADEVRRVEALVAERLRLPRVLLVEDHPGDADLVRAALDPRTWSVLHAGGLAGALAALAGERIDAVLLDLDLPDARGIEAVQRLGAQFPDVPIVVLTGLDDEATSLQAVHEGAQDYLLKSQLNERSLSHALHYAIERHRAETALGYLAAVVESSSDAVLRCTLDGTIASWNRGARQIFDLTADLAVGGAFTDLVVADRRAEARALFEALPRNRGAASLDVPCLRKDGRRLHVSLTLSPIRDRVGRVVAASVVARDVTRQKDLEEEVLALSLRDELTGLLNRRGFIQLAEQQLKLAKRNGVGTVLLYVDLDRLKSINDRFGHAEGDRALVSAAGLLEKTFRETSIVGRLGGDEFAVLLVDASPDSAPGLVRRLQSRVARFNAERRRPYALSMSAGAAVSPPRRPVSLEVMCSRADAAMYGAKATAATPRPGTGRGRRVARPG